MAKKAYTSDEPTLVEKNVGELLSKSDVFVEKYLKQTIVAVGAIIIIVIGSIGFHYYYLVPKSHEAEKAIFVAQNYFESQQWELALNGDSLGNLGFLDVISDFGSTSSSNLSKVYAGLCEYQLKDYESALKHLKSYSIKDQLFGAQVLAAMGDCEVNLGNVKESVSYFGKAAAKANSSQFSPIYLNKEAIAYESLGEYKKALAVYEKIKSQYPQSPEAVSIDKYIERAKLQLKGE
ncbi:MAG: hypothetical protein EZS26_000630 [Candidatus Ordinivivax streblomastigis]|uniref:Uncharacterized protein n=1 Tax=Candidatus Ordinivivax streblomastigis TaxID=2540710 RepID=A0A5M8P3H0_9BACT|nr:MAG: hypothetical protein EZS26_000630 [Candidatus Ordinivivax streblomastigis]